MFFRNDSNSNRLDDVRYSGQWTSNAAESFVYQRARERECSGSNDARIYVSTVRGKCIQRRPFNKKKKFRQISPYPCLKHIFSAEARGPGPPEEPSQYVV